MTATLTETEPLRSNTELLPGYRVSEHLARGQVLDVYSVHSRERACLCIVKTPRPDRMRDTAARARLLTEGRLLQHLSHPNLVRAYETHDEPRPAVVLEILTSETLSHLVDRRRQGLPAHDLVELGLQLTAVLGYLHHHDTLHLDLKPSNIVADGGRARLLDLSHAGPPGPCSPDFGTREYMPPEQFTGGEVGPASDVYGLGGVLYRAATRHRPCTRSERQSDPHRRARLTRLHRRALPAQLPRLIAACLEPRPSARPSLPEVTGVLEALARHESPTQQLESSGLGTR